MGKLPLHLNCTFDFFKLVRPRKSRNREPLRKEKTNGGCTLNVEQLTQGLEN
jgi:hypothetical protein